MIEDAAEIYWSHSAPEPLTKAGGAYCYVDGGFRRTSGWPAGDPFFRTPCDSGAT